DEPRQERGGPEAVAEGAVHEQRRDCEHYAEARLPTVLASRPGQLEIERVHAGRAVEAGERVRSEVEERVDVQLVADVPRGKRVQRPGRRPTEQRREPVDDRGDDDGDA